MPKCRRSREAIRREKKRRFDAAERGTKHAYGASDSTDLSEPSSNLADVVHTKPSKKLRSRRLALELEEREGYLADCGTSRIMRLQRRSDQYVQSFNARVLDYRAIPSDWKAITYGKVFIVNQETKQTIGVIRVTPFTDMSVTDTDKLLMVAQHFEEDAKLHPECKSNGAHTSAACTGTMSCIGYRKSQMKGQAFGIYRKSTNVDLSRWDALRQRDGMVHQVLGAMFRSLAPRICSDHQMLMDYLNLPYAGYSNSAAADAHAATTLFTPQITYTRRNQSGHFFNTAHCDRDESEFAYGVWIPIDRGSDAKAVELGLSEKGFVQIGGAFYNVPYGFYIDFSKINGLVESVWRASEDLHGTCTAEFSSSSYYRLGCSAQINRKLAQAVSRWHSDQTSAGVVDDIGYSV